MNVRRLWRERGRGRALVKWGEVSCDQKVSLWMVTIRMYDDLPSLVDTPWVGYKDIGAELGDGNSG